MNASITVLALPARELISERSLEPPDRAGRPVATSPVAPRSRDGRGRAGMPSKREPPAPARRRTVRRGLPAKRHSEMSPDAAQALADLTEISSQIQAAVIFDG